MPKHTVRMTGKTIARTAGVDNDNLAAGAAELQCGREARKAATDQLMSVGSSLLRTLLRPDVSGVEAMIMADKTNKKSLSKLHYEAGPAHITAQIEALLRQLHAKALLKVPDPAQSARLFAALFKGSDLLLIARFDEARADDEHEIQSYCRSAVAMFIAAHSGAR